MNDQGAEQARKDGYEQGASWGWITGYSADIGIPIPDLMAGAARYLETGDDLVWDVVDIGMNPETEPEFWKHYNVVTGRPIPVWTNFFSCEC